MTKLSLSMKCITMALDSVKWSVREQIQSRVRWLNLEFKYRLEQVLKQHRKNNYLKNSPIIIQKQHCNFYPFPHYTVRVSCVRTQLFPAAEFASRWRCFVIVTTFHVQFSTLRRLSVHPSIVSVSMQCAFGGVLGCCDLNLFACVCFSVGRSIVILMSCKINM